MKRTATSIGREAEEAAAEYLRAKGLEVVTLNWRTRRAEIDIIAEKRRKISLLRRQTIIHFVEVKYRRSAEFGDGLEYITQKKLGQLEFAAAEWVSSNSWDGDYQIDAIAVTGNAIDGWKFDYRPNIIF